jgi:predicted aldo/keto reductase-like oxidoreductase
MEPLRGGAFGRMAQELTDQLKAVRPDDSTARWAFRWVGSYPNILTVLSGMNRMDHLEENVKTFSPLEVCTESENALLADIADQMSGFPTIPCTACEYCLPCPYGVDIPGNFSYYNEAVNNHILPLPEKEAADYAARKQQFADGLAKALPKTDSWARSCTDCEECLAKCPQQIRIPNQMARIVELLRKR